MPGLRPKSRPRLIMIARPDEPHIIVYPNMSPDNRSHHLRRSLEKLATDFIVSGCHGESQYCLCFHVSQDAPLAPKSLEIFGKQLSGYHRENHTSLMGIGPREFINSSSRRCGPNEHPRTIVHEGCMIFSVISCWLLSEDNSESFRQDEGPEYTNLTANNSVANSIMPAQQSSSELHEKAFANNHHHFGFQDSPWHLHYLIESDEPNVRAIADYAQSVEGQASINMVDSRGLMPLHLAAARGHIAVVEILLVAGASLRLAAASGHGNIVELFIQESAITTSEALRISLAAGVDNEGYLRPIEYGYDGSSPACL